MDEYIDEILVVSTDCNKSSVINNYIISMTTQSVIGSVMSYADEGFCERVHCGRMIDSFWFAVIAGVHSLILLN